MSYTCGWKVKQIPTKQFIFQKTNRLRASIFTQWTHSQFHFKFFSPKNKTAKLEKRFFHKTYFGISLSMLALYHDMFLFLNVPFLFCWFTLIKHLRVILSNSKEKSKLQISQKYSFGIANLKQIEKMIHIIRNTHVIPWKTICDTIYFKKHSGDEQNKKKKYTTSLSKHLLCTMSRSYSFSLLILFVQKMFPQD